MAMLMGICYLVTLTQEQLSHLLHVVLHELEMPDTVLDHDTSSQDIYEIHHHHDEHLNAELVHEHDIIDFLDLIFKSTNSDTDSDKQLSSKIKFKKFFEIRGNPKMKFLWLDKHQVFTSVTQKSKKGYLTIVQEPPQFC